MIQGPTGDADRWTSTVGRDIRARLSAERDIAMEAIKPSDSLLDGLGMDGDDAVEFFEGLEPIYGPAFDPLYRNWSRHFGPEGFGDIWLLLVIASIFPAFYLVSLGHSWATVSAAALLLTTLAIACWKWVSAWRGPGPMQITVAQLIEAAETGQWPIIYPEERP